MKNLILAISIASVFLVSCTNTTSTETPTTTADSVACPQDSVCSDNTDSTVSPAPVQDTVK